MSYRSFTRRLRVSSLALCGAVAACAALISAGCALTSASPPARIGQDCGTVTRAVTDNSSAAQCLLAAYTHCRTATLVYVERGVDTDDTHTITVKPQGGSCAVSDADVHYFASGGGKTSRSDYHCQGVTQAQATVAFTSTGFQPWPGAIIVTACGQEGDIGLPTAPAPQTPQSIGVNCGLVNGSAGHVVGDASGPEDCLWRAYTVCQAASLSYLGVGDNHGYVLSTLPNQATCALYLQETDTAFSRLFDALTCSKLLRQSNGLYAPLCVAQSGGVEMALLIPAR